MSIGYEYGASNRTFIAADHDIMFLRSYFEESMRIHEAQNQELAELRAKLAEAKDIPMKYKRMQFNAELQTENESLHAKLAEAQSQVAMLRNLLERIRDDDRSSLDLDDYKDLLRYLAATQPKG
jgi:predicted RNase H-like nuclease (RuvC/YqgF family)